jgi:hypothetical protein
MFENNFSQKTTSAKHIVDPGTKKSYLSLGSGVILGKIFDTDIHDLFFIDNEKPVQPVTIPNLTGVLISP